MTQLSIQTLAMYIGGTIDTADQARLEDSIHGVNKIEDAGEGEVTFLANAKYARFAETTHAACIIVDHDFQPPTGLRSVLIRVAQPQQAFLKLVQYFEARYRTSIQTTSGFRHPTAVVADSARVDATASIGAHVIVSNGCSIGAGAALHSGVVLYDNVSIGEGSVLHANVVCYDGTRIGARCLIHAGTVLGADGFGFAERTDGSFEKIPQIGTVVIEDDVEIGANCTIDRAALGSTVIEQGVKLDNLIHIAHNAVLGEHTAIAAQTGVSGSTRIGKRNRIAGQVGFVGHISTSDNVVVLAQSGVSKSLDNKGVYFGSPAKSHADALKQEAALRQLPQLLKEFRALKTELENLKAQQQSSS
jgi:UDP-3-O-[3-hydroxymyristoyl] glucosamine N-acyltransferase